MTYMLTSCENKLAKEWEKYKGFTVRPLASTTEYYFNLIQKIHSHQQFLMLGGTPEIRSIFQTLNYPITIVDKSPTVVRAMGKLTKKQKPFSANEIFIEKDWQKLHSIKRKYDFVIGDDAINMLSWSDFNKFLKSIYQLLNANGIFVCHLLVKPDDTLINMTFENVIKEFNSGNIKSHYDLASRLNFICYDKANYGMGWQNTITQIGKEKLNTIKNDFDFIETFGLCNSHFYCPPQLEFENLATQYFTIEEIYYPHEHEYCLFEPVYILKKNSELK